MINNLKSLEWFKNTYPNSEDMYWAISDYINENLDNNISHVEQVEELFNFMCEYTIERTGLDPRRDPFVLGE